MDKRWTPSQLDAISARNGSILVGAAAGSGKTAVLVERVIERIVDSENPSDVNRLLIVTFTKAAAQQMRERIAAAIEKKLREKPDDKNLISQQMLLPSAQICTIDAFCSKLVREHFEQCDLSPDFGIADSGELSLLSGQALNETLEQMYLEDESFKNLSELVFMGRDDSYLAKIIEEIYVYSMSYPFPSRWINELYERFDTAQKIENSSYGRLIFDYCSEAMEYCREIIYSMEKTMALDDGYYKAYSKAVESDKAQLEYCFERLLLGDWNGFCFAIKNINFIRRGTPPKELKGTAEAILLDSQRKRLKKILQDTILPLLSSSAEEFVSDMKYLAPMVKSLCTATMLYSQKLSALKKEKQLASFSDIAHYALELLVLENGGEIQKTPLAIELSKSFDEILIDEYQDTNKAQDMLFTAISNDNLFRVGDVKQSIYRFRQAMPEIFIELKNKLSLYKRSEENYPSKILLKNNFRSRKSVTECVNYIFSLAMSKQCGDVDYNDEERLVFSAFYDEKRDECAELHLLQPKLLDSEEATSDEYSANYVASMIRNLVDSGYTVKDGDTERELQYKDICVLLRAVGTKGAIYADEMKRKGIPCFTSFAANFFSSTEISLMLNLLRIIDNPKQDIPLMSVMLSVLFGFSIDELSLLRSNCKHGDIYSCLLESKLRGEKRSEDFLSALSRWRTLAVCMSVSDFIRMIYDETAIDAVVSSSKGSKAKKENLLLLLDYAEVYEKAGYIGLSGFIRFIDRLERSDSDLQGALGVSAQADVVQIMTIHHSKGLEFPVCIVAGCGSSFNRTDETKNMTISSKYGLGIVRRDIETMAQYPSVCHTAVKNAIRQDSVSEEMRLLYVAMTRAKEKLIMVGAVKSLENAVLKLAFDYDSRRGRISPFACSLASCYNDWIIGALLHHPDAYALREIAGLDESAVLPADFSLKLVIDEGLVNYEQQTNDEQLPEVDEKLLKILNERFSWRYEYEDLTRVVSKRAASEVDKNFVDREYFASARPEFMNEGVLTGAGRGIATHTFLQFADYENAARCLDDEIKAVFEKGHLTKIQRDSVNRKQLKTFFKSELALRIMKSECVMREKKFTIGVPICELYPELSKYKDEQVMIQGIADCAFVENGKIVVVDYKTDSLNTEEEFCEKYRGQVETYKKALKLCTGYDVCETILYSLHLGKEIRLEG